jgi:hypothetical protein
MSNTQPLIATSFDGITGETTVRELTAEEIAELPQDTDETLPTS